MKNGTFPDPSFSWPRTFAARVLRVTISSLFQAGGLAIDSQGNVVVDGERDQSP